MKKKYQLKIQGMNCASCVSKIENSVGKLPGVQSVNVNLSSEEGLIFYEDTLLKGSDLIEAIQKLGFKAKPIRMDQELNSSASNPPLEHGEKIKIFLSFFLSIPLFLPMLLTPLGLGFHLPFWIQFIFASLVQFYIGGKFYQSSWLSLRARTLTMDVLVALGASGAYGLSLWLWIKNPSSTTHLYFESSSMVISFVLLGKYLEQKAKKKTTEAIKSLYKLRPQTARRLLDKNGEEEVSLEEIQLDDKLLIRPGESVPCDGMVLEGISEINESLLTGESLPVKKEKNDNVIGGSLNGEGPLVVRVTALGPESLLSRMIELVEEAQFQKTPTQRMVDKVSGKFIPVVLLVAVLTLLLTGIFSGDWEKALLHSVAVLAMACPCALGLATPTAIMVGVGLAAKKGILVKNGASLETLHQVSTICLDKTGTLTEGKPSVTQLCPLHLSEEDFFLLLFSLLKTSEHPFAQAVRVLGAERKVEPIHASFIKILPGQGVEGVISSTHYSLGTKNFALQRGIKEEEIEDLLRKFNFKGESVSFLWEEDKLHLLGAVFFKDELRPNGKEAVESLKKLGIKVVILTGDHRLSAQRVSDELGIEEFQAELLPGDKTSYIQKLQEKGEIVAMVGDGLNDAPSLMQADVGVAISSGAEVSMHAAGITLLRHDPLLLFQAVSLSRLTFRKIKQNLLWAFIYNLIGIPLAALGFLSPHLAGAAMALSSVSVVLNSLMTAPLNLTTLLREDRSPEVCDDQV